MWRGNQAACNVLRNRKNVKYHLHKWDEITKNNKKTQTQEWMCCIIAKMESAEAGSLQEEISRGMVTRVDRDYNALQRPLGVNKKSWKYIYTINAKIQMSTPTLGQWATIRIGLLQWKFFGHRFPRQLTFFRPGRHKSPPAGATVMLWMPWIPHFELHCRPPLLLNATLFYSKAPL